MPASPNLLAGATTFRFDGSDLMPGEVGAGSFWKGMTDWASGTSDIDTVLKGNRRLLAQEIEFDV